MDIPDVLIQGTGGSSTLSRDPRVPHGAFSIIVSILQLVKVEVDLLKGTVIAMASL